MARTWTLRGRLTALVALAVAVAVAAVAFAAWFATRSVLRRQIDSSLRAVQGPARSVTLDALTGVPVPLISTPDQPVLQILTSDGRSFTPEYQDALPFSPADLAVARGERTASWRDVQAGGVHLRVLTVPVRPGVAVQVGRSMTEVDQTLRRLGWVLAGLVTAGAGAAAVAGRSVTRSALAPVGRVTAAAEQVAATQDLAARIEVSGDDEVARLAGSVNAMLEALDDARRQQRHLAEDAAHELRTPLTSLRANLELLARAEGSGTPLPAADRAALLADLTSEVNELTVLVGELVELARGETDPEPVVEVELLELAQRVAERWRDRVTVTGPPVTVPGRRAMLERAVGNLVRNALAWSPAEEPVEVTIGLVPWEVELTVADRGPGVDPADVPRLFDRFYRSDAARERPGSGLGLAIVAQAASAHGGRVGFLPREGGGSVFRLVLPAAQPNSDA